MENVKCVVVGDGAVGKTSMLLSYTRNKFPVEYVPTIFDNITLRVEINGKSINVSLWDTAGQEEYARLRYLSYPETDVFLLCFSLADISTFENIQKWYNEITYHCPEAKIVLVGMKLDLRYDFEKNSFSCVSYDDAVALAKKLKLVDYVECSALTQEGLRKVFEVGLTCTNPAYFKPESKRKHRMCELL